MDTLKKVFSPTSHESDDKPTHGDHDTQRDIDRPREDAGQSSHLGPRGTDDPYTQPSDTAPSGLAPPDQSNVQDRASGAGVRSDMPRTSHEQSTLTPEAAGTSGATNTSTGRGPYPPAAQSEDSATSANPPDEKCSAQPAGGTTATVGQTSTYSSYPLAKGDSTSHTIDRASDDPTTYRQAEKISADRATSTGSGAGPAEAATGYAQPSRSDNSNSARGADSTGADGMTAREGDHFGSKKTMPGQFPMGESDNPYSSSHLDPRVDPHANHPGTDSTPPTRANVGSNQDPAERSRQYGSPSDNRGVSGTKAMAEPFDGPKGTSQPLHGPKGTAEPLRGEGQHHPAGDAPVQPGSYGGAPTTERNIPTGTTTGPTTAAPGPGGAEPREEGHAGRNAAVGGAAAAGAGMGGAHEYSRHQPEREEDGIGADRAHQQAVEDSHGASEREEKAHDKALAKEEKKADKEHEKAVKKEEKEHEKAVKKEEKEHEKAVKAEEKKEKEHEKAAAKEEKEAEKRADSENKDKKKGGLLGLFKRRRDSKGNEVEHEEDDHANADTSPGVGADEAGKHHRQNKLTKEPPPGYGYSGDAATPAYADYAIKENNHPGAQTVTGGYTAPAPAHDPNKYSGAAGASGMGAYEAGEHQEHRKLTKEPPPGVGYSGDSATPAYADYPIRENRHPGAYTAPDPVNDGSRYTGGAVPGNEAMGNRPYETHGTSSPDPSADAPSRGYRG